jgi:plasmid maintenance system killer protein
VIRNCRDKMTAQVFKGRLPRSLSRDLAITARRKLLMLEAAEQLAVLRPRPAIGWSRCWAI